MRWSNGDLKVRIGGTVSKQISSQLYGLRHNISSEFARKPRGFSEIEGWKATAFRQFVHYTGPVVLREFVHEVIYKHFMLLSVTLHILLNSHLVKECSDYAQKLVCTFVEHYGQLYGKENLVYNVHSLLHLSFDAKIFGMLDNISSFPFENYLMKLKKRCEKANISTTKSCTKTF